MEEGAATLVSGRYELLERIGAGGFGETWRAHDTLLDVTVAVKVFHDADEERAEKALREARSLARYAQLPGIVAVRDLVRDAGSTYLVMDFIEGSDLADALAAGGQLRLEETLHILRPVAEALGQLHKEGYVHRDVSPENIRVRQDNTGVLLDFGSVMDLGQQRRETILVKPGYAPPEQYGDPSTQGPWSDVYALAATAYHCLCGAAPPDSLQRTFTDELKRPAQLGADLPADAEAALMAGLALDYRERTQSVGELIAGLAGEGAASAGEQDAASGAPASAARPASGSPPEPAQALSSQTQAEPQPPSARSASSSAPNKPGGKSAGKPRRRIKRWAPIAAAVVVIAVIVAVLVSVNGNTLTNTTDRNAYYADFGMSRVLNTEVTDDIIDMVGNDANTDWVTFRRCVISDAQIERLSKMENIKSLDFDTCTGFSSLGPLAEMPNLQTINISYMEGVDLNELIPAEMPGITNFKLDNVSITSGAQALKRLPNVEILRVTGVDLSQYGVEVLSGLEKLSNLMMQGCNLPTLEWVTNCPYLYYLNASNNGISDLSPLASCPDLSTLKLGHNAITSLQGLEGHEKLKTLNLAENHVEDASALASCRALEELGLRDNRLSDLSFCESLTNLVALDASHNQITDISKLSGSLRIKGLVLNDNQISDISVLGNGFSKLEELNLANNEITSLESLASCAELKDVSVLGNQLSSLDGLQDKPKLGYLLANDNHISDISALASSVGKMEGLDLGGNKISDLSALSGLGSQSASFVIVVLDHNNISSLDGIPTRLSYYTLVLYGNPVADFSSFLESDVKWYGVVYLPYSEGAVYGNLSSRYDLDKIDIVGVPYDQQALLEQSMQVEQRSSTSKPQYITTEQADSDLASARAELYMQLEQATSSLFGFTAIDEDGDGSDDSESQS